MPFFYSHNIYFTCCYCCCCCFYAYSNWWIYATDEIYANISTVDVNVYTNTFHSFIYPFYVYNIFYIIFRKFGLFSDLCEKLEYVNKTRIKRKRKMKFRKNNELFYAIEIIIISMRTEKKLQINNQRFALLAFITRTREPVSLNKNFFLLLFLQSSYSVSLWNLNKIKKTKTLLNSYFALKKKLILLALFFQILTAFSIFCRIFF